jgi:hypothetical protein
MSFDRLLHFLYLHDDALGDVGWKRWLLLTLLEMIVFFVEIEEVSDCYDTIELDIQGLIGSIYIWLLNDLLMNLFDTFLLSFLCLLPI